MRSILIAAGVAALPNSSVDDTLKHALTIQLIQSPFLNILPDDRVRNTLKLMGRPTDEPISRSVAREICQRASLKAMLAGSISRLGNQYIVGVDALNCQSGDLIASEQSQAENKEAVLKVVGNAASNIRQKLGESLSSIQKYDTPVEEATTSSLEALKSFTLAEANARSGKQLESIPQYQRAIELDPNFARAYTELATIYGNLGENVHAIEYQKKAYDLRTRVSERERFGILTNYHWIVTGDLDKEIEAEESWAQAYPREPGPLNNLAVNYARLLGQFDKSIELGNRALQLNPHEVGTSAAMAMSYLALNRVDEARSTIESDFANNPDNPITHAILYEIALLQVDDALARREFDWGVRKQAGDNLVLLFAASSAFQRGQFQTGRNLSSQFLSTVQAAKLTEVAAQTLSCLAVPEAEAGNFVLARQMASKSKSLGLTRINGTCLALVLSMTGDSAPARSVMEELNHRYAADTLIQSVYLPMAKALLDSSPGNSAKSVDDLQPATRFELGSDQSFEPIYVRGMVYLRAQQPQQAVAQFQKIVDHRGVSPFALEYALAHLGLARAHALQNDTEKARTAYQDFFALWKDADPDIPILKQAKAEYAKLQ